MKVTIFKYLSLTTAIYLVFTQVIACGGQMYQADVRDDHPQESIPAAATDPASPQYGIHAAGGWQEIPIRFKYDPNLSHEQIAGLERAMLTWETAVGKKLFVKDGFDTRTGDDFEDLGSSLSDDVNGHYGDHDWSKTKKQQQVLATTIWQKTAYDVSMIETADIRFNLQYYTIGNTLNYDMEVEEGKIAVDMETLALHELGHLLGLSHVDAAVDRYSIMAPVVYIGIGMHNRRLTMGDLERIQAIYGCEEDACDIEATHEALEATAARQAEAQGGGSGAVSANTN